MLLMLLPTPTVIEHAVYLHPTKQTNVFGIK
jgi:hypothetical protein